MKTPFGKECSYFYGNYFRGKNDEECRLIGGRSAQFRWTPDLCKTCPVPDIQRANGCQQMTITAEVRKTMLGFKRQVVVHAYCRKTHDFVDDPYIGCGHCNDLPDIFIQD
ncbi:MAG: hypothetical protein JW750_07560 [Anaerolineaceae bacterium]|nr:hypothetical protein [Anaerolineaceae bacterium]